ncbi:15575_t:CDS:2, partial [Funneliformis caledonium]
IKKDLAIAYQKDVLALKELIFITCETTSITTDLWTARSNDRYIGVTLHWLSSNFEIYDVILAVEKIEYPHTEFGLAGKIVCAITDNGANMKRLLESGIV